MKSKYLRLTGETAALITSGLTYWSTLYPLARREIRRWERRARQIPDATLRAQALHKLTDERLNPEAAAFFAVLGPCWHRPRLVRLMVGYQIAYDYIDAINELPDATALRNGLQLHQALNDALSADGSSGDYYRHHPQRHDNGYLVDLVRSCQRELHALPSAATIKPTLVSAAERCGEAQSRNHAIVTDGAQQLITWSEAQPTGEPHLWWELAAGGISCLGLHALFALSASEATLQDAKATEAAYFPSVCAISALLDSLIDHARDLGTSNHSFISHYTSSAQAQERFAAILVEATSLLRTLKGSRRHLVILMGIASFYLSQEEAQSFFAAEVAGHTRAHLSPISRPILATMRLKRRQLGRRGPA